jgi:cysteine-rich repeat protein
MRRIAAAAVAALIASSAAPLHAQGLRSPVRVTVESLFGQGTLIVDAYASLLVTLENTRNRPLRGELEITTNTYEGPTSRHRTHVDLPPRERRTIVFTVFADQGTSHFTATYSPEGARVAENTVSIDYTAGSRSIVELGDPPRLRGALLDLDVDEMFDTGPRQVRVPVGVVQFDRSSRDPMMPTAPAGWASVKVLVAHAPVLERASERQRRALTDWLRAGGRLLVFPRSPSDVDGAFLRTLLAERIGLSRNNDEPPRMLEPLGVERFPLVCGESHRVETFGCSAAIGHGRVFVATYDGSAQPAIDSGVPRDLVRSIFAAPDTVHPAMPYGREGNQLGADWDGNGSFATMRAALDPNEGFRPALVLVALVLLVYVVIVGPINFGWVQKKNRPTLALVTTPIAAFGCLAALMTVGYVGKGVSMRYRRFELVEVVEGDQRAIARRYVGLFTTRPGSFDLDDTSPSSIAHRIEGGGNRGPVHVHESGRVRLTDFRSGLWETTFVREDRFLDLGGAIRFERDELRLAAIENRSRLSLQDAFVVDSSGAIFPVGDVAPGARASIARASLGSLNSSPYMDPAMQAQTLVSLLDLEAADERPYVEGLLQTTGMRFLPPDVPVLYARVRVPPERIADTFRPEADYRWIRVVPRVRGAAVVLSPVPVPPTYGSPVCGNYTVEGSELCDDGNVIPGDGCESDCTITADAGPPPAPADAGPPPSPAPSATGAE